MLDSEYSEKTRNFVAESTGNYFILWKVFERLALLDILLRWAVLLGYS